MKQLKQFFARYPALFLIALIEGGVVMAIEIMGGHLLATYYGSSVYLWAGILGTSLAGLAAGYFAGSWSSAKITMRKLQLITAGIAVLTALVPFVSQHIIPMTLSMEIRSGIIISCFILIFPALALCGMVSPQIIRLITDDGRNAGKNAGTVFAVSTAGGIIFTFVTGFILIPYTGIRSGMMLMALAMLLTAIFSILQGRAGSKQKTAKPA